jgi:hypothetical protein
MTTQTAAPSAPSMSKRLTDSIVIVGPVRLSYLHVFQPVQNKLRKVDEYSVTLLIPKAPTPQCPRPEGILKLLRETSDAVLAAKFKSLPRKYDPRLLDGDAETDNDGEPKYPGYWFLSCRSDADKPAPVLLDRNRRAVLQGGDWVSGDWGNVKLSLYAYEHEGTRGVGAGLRAIQFTHKDEPFGNAQTPEQVAAEFDELEEEDILG